MQFKVRLVNKVYLFKVHHVLSKEPRALFHYNIPALKYPRNQSRKVSASSGVKSLRGLLYSSGPNRGKFL